MNLSNQRHLFDLPEEVIYLNCANMSPLLKSVSHAGIDAINSRKHPWNIKGEDWFNPTEELRSLFARIVNAQSDNIAIIPSVSYGISIAANNLKVNSGEQIVVLDQQYPSNYYTWQKLAIENSAEIVTVNREEEKTWSESVIECITERTAIVAVPNCHWTDGSLIDLEQLSKKVKSVNAKLVIDGSQSIGAYPMDVSKIKPDFLITVGYKWLLGPYHLAYLYADSKYFQDGKPIEQSWLSRFGSEDFTKLVDYTDRFRPGARRFDAGEFPGFIQIPMAIAALGQIIGWGVDNIQSTLSEITARIEVLAKDSGFRTMDHNKRVDHMIGLQLRANDDIEELARLFQANDIYLGFRGSSIRIAPHLYTARQDIEKLFSIISKSNSN